MEMTDQTGAHNNQVEDEEERAKRWALRDFSKKKTLSFYDTCNCTELNKTMLQLKKMVMKAENNLKMAKWFCRSHKVFFSDVFI